MEKYLFSNEKKISARSDVIWPFKKIICQNRINKNGQIQPKCLRNYAWKIMMWHIVLKIKSVFLMLWRSMCLVMKKNFRLIWRHLTIQKNYLPKSHQQNQPNSAKTLKKLCLKNHDVAYRGGKELNTQGWQKCGFLKKYSCYCSRSKFFEKTIVFAFQNRFKRWKKLKIEDFTTLRKKSCFWRLGQLLALQNLTWIWSSSEHHFHKIQKKCFLLSFKLTCVPNDGVIGTNGFPWL